MSSDETKQRITALRGRWQREWDDILLLDPDYLESYARLSMVPHGSSALDPATKELVLLALSAAATHLHVPGIRLQLAGALHEGATPGEVMETIELTTGLGMHAMLTAVPLLREVLDEEGLRSGPAEPTELQTRLREEFVAGRGYWDEMWTDVLEFDPEFFAAFTEFSSHPWRTGTLEPKVREFIYIAFDSAATHMFASGLKMHLRRALGFGATTDELLEVIELASLIGFHGAEVAVPLLRHEMKKRSS
ncbi:carboxymuconolactone decarboxylase family protein [Herbiconiux sp. CPCC 203407]|uniref:Carboxymuconolactone decarboxylase family protein n=1 Tax=Herbiconiux oxytropis TaxID=2970915 RepID=A0AA41XGV2_9MICO|nr:carboxymuconolactone decarboxylase family protein [Herbiconiux oxytropis]MCS5723911.1 carboxymuconolactone decarboxylase family protein [Herbiconiux oxytropis]MCS5725433.1 carboxymuconolactone decarboxylase family protein [Herbiconiux oxytropis]